MYPEALDTDVQSPMVMVFPSEEEKLIVTSSSPREEDGVVSSLSSMVMVVEAVPRVIPSGNPLAESVMTTLSFSSTSLSSVVLRTKVPEDSPSAITAVVSRVKSSLPAEPLVDSDIVMGSPEVLISFRVKEMVEDSPSVNEEGEALTDNCTEEVSAPFDGSSSSPHDSSINVLKRYK